MVVFKMPDSVPSPRYSPVCYVLRQWKTSLIPTYRIYRLYSCVYTSQVRTRDHPSRDHGHVSDAGQAFTRIRARK